MNERVLFVDDEENVLNGFRRQLRKDFDVSTAASGSAALEVMREEGPFAVVVSDMRMPEMDGIAFLKEAQKLAPDTVRLMLTGNADQQTAIDAVNEGHVFRFLNKPCSVDVLSDTVSEALDRYRVDVAEKALLSGTLNGSIKLLMDILALAAPSVWSVDSGMRETAQGIARAMQVGNDWEMEVATMLARIAYVTLPPETLQRVRNREPLSEAENKIVQHLPGTAHGLLVQIPRLKNVARIVLYQGKNFDGTGYPADAVAGEEIPMESRILRVLHDLKELVERDGMATADALLQMRQQGRIYDPRVVDTVGRFLSEEGEEAQISPPLELSVGELRPGQMLVSNVETRDGRMLFTAGHSLTEAIVGRILNYHDLHRVKEPIVVSVPNAP